MSDIPQLFFYRVGDAPVPVLGRVWTHPITLEQIHNPQPDKGKGLLALLQELPQPNPQLYDSYPTFAVTPDGNNVAMSWASTSKPMWSGFTKPKIDALKAYADNLVDKLARNGFDTESFAWITLVHFVRHGHSPQGSDQYKFQMDDASWQNRNSTNLGQFITKMSNDINAIGTNYQAHRAAIQVLHDAEDRQGMLDYDFTTGWPTP